VKDQVVPKPPEVVVWITRDSDIDGALDEAVDVWSAPPVRFDLDRGAFWVSAEWDISTRIGRWTLARCWRYCHTAPDDDRQVIRVERGASSGPPEQRAEYIPLDWLGGEPLWHAVRGHVPGDVARRELLVWKVDLTDYDGPRYRWAFKKPASDPVHEYVLDLSREPRDGAFPVTVFSRKKPPVAK
jgi:hypothetical protein